MSKKPKQAPPQPVAEDDPAERAERMQKLLTGRIRSDNPVVQYMVGKLRGVVQEADGLSTQLQQLEARTTQTRNRLLELRGMRQKYVEDIEAFDKPDPEKPEKATSEEAKAEPEAEPPVEAAAENAA